jgi:hypothetical protein
MKLMHMPQVSDSGEPDEHSHNALLHIAFPIVLQGRHSRMVISELNTAPMHTPANASPRHHWSSRHSSGPERIATPFSVEDLALKPYLLLHAGFNRRFQDVPKHMGEQTIPRTGLSPVGNAALWAAHVMRERRDSFLSTRWLSEFLYA